MMKRWGLVFAAVIVIMVVLIAMAFGAFQKSQLPDAAAQTPQEKIRFALTSQFANLSDKKKAEYLKAAMGKDGPRALFQASRDLSPAERKVLRDNTRPATRAMMEERMNKYFELSEAERVAYLDRMIDETRDRPPGPPPGGGGGPPPPDAGKNFGSANAPPQNGPPRGPPGLSHIRDHIETTAPETRAKEAEFHRAMRARMAARGIHPAGPPGPPPGG